VVTPAQRRAVVADARERRPLTERRVCRYFGIHRALVRYPSQRDPQTALRMRLRELAATKVRWGSPRLTWSLRREGWPVNHKRIERLMREERLLVRQRPRRKRVAMARVPTPVPTRPDTRWSMDFVRDTLIDGRPFRVWTVVDDATRECPMLLVERSLTGVRVAEALEWLQLIRGLPDVLVCDNGPEFVSQALDQWASQRGVTLDFIRPGHPVENCFIESFNGRLRDECLNVHHFRTLEEARTVIEAWRVEYNTERPHGSLGWQTPEGFAAQLEQDTAGNFTTTLRS
jgi:putative transposase